MKILLLGGNGYIGSRLYQHLDTSSKEVDSVDIGWFSNPELSQDYSDLSKDFLSQYSTIVLLAGHSSVPMCIENRLSAFKNNVENFVILLDKLENQKFIYASSSSVYGATKEVAATEDWKEFSPQNYYDLTKQEIDFYARLSSKNYYGLRFGTVNGYSPNLRTDIMINKMFSCAINDSKITIFNKEIYRPILGLTDLCRAVEKIIDSPDNPGIYNLASFNSTVGEIADEISKALNVPVIDMGSTPAYNFSIDTTKFEKAYGFTFKESVFSIVKSLKDNWEQINKSNRSNKKLYGDTNG